ncbi:MAG: hypothetical protein IJ794_06975 [Lachnospiraceae bacterium]|nr:hypothetical protein [Lachnospiraceae bacterium]
MAAAKKPVAVATPAEKAEVKAVAAPAAEVKAEKPAKKETVKKETVKKETAKKAPAKKEAEKKETAKKAPAKKAELKSVVELQVAGNSYTNDDLVKIAKDVWQYDLQQKEADLVSVELYVKAEEKKVYYVMNKDFTGSFDI